MKKVKNLLYIVIFFILFVIGFREISNLVRYKAHGNDTMGLFYQEKKDSIDVLILGSSEAYNAFSPMQMWNESGITSYNLSSSSQPIPVSYYLLKEGIRTQHPKVVVLETYIMYYKRDYHSFARLHQGVDAMPLNKNKLEMMRDFFSRTMTWDEQLEFAFPIMTYHSRIYNLKKHDYSIKKKYLRGYLVRKSFKARKEPDYVTEKADVYDCYMEYLDKIIDLCEEEGIELILCKTPLSSYRTYADKMKIYNTVEAHAKEKGVTYVNFDALRDEIQLDYSIDFYDEAHVNSLGAEKITSYMTNYLQDNYDMTDHRKDAEYDNWNEDYKKYKKVIEKAKNMIYKQAEQQKNK